MKRTAKIMIAFAVILLVVVSSIICLKKSSSTDTKLSIVATNFPAYDFARAVASDKADIQMLIKPGAEVHNFEPTPQDIISIKNSDVFIYTGGESDKWVEGILQDIDATKTLTIKMMDIVSLVGEELVDGMEQERDDEQHDGGAPEYDEHVWTSLRNAKQIINRIKDELIKISPENRHVFENNAKTYTDKLANIDQTIQAIVDDSNNKIIIFGDRFPLRYFADDYGLDYYAAFPGCSEQTEVSSRTIAFLVDKIKSENIPVVFKIELSSGNIADAIASETGAKVLTFNSAHNISSDDFNSGLTYATIMENNVKVLKEALQK